MSHVQQMSPQTVAAALRKGACVAIVVREPDDTPLCEFRAPRLIRFRASTRGVCAADLAKNSYLSAPPAAGR